MARTTPITDFLFRLEVDSDFVNKVVDPNQRDDALLEFGLDEDARNAIVSAIEGIETKDFSDLQSRVLAEHPDSDTVHIIPRAWVR
jgi:hypothetical protein